MENGQLNPFHLDALLKSEKRHLRPYSCLHENGLPYSPYIFLENFQRLAMLDLIHVLETRLWSMEVVAKQGVIPGQLDTYELEQMLGRIKELKFFLKLLTDNHITGEIREFKE